MKVDEQRLAPYWNSHVAELSQLLMENGFIKQHYNKWWFSHTTYLPSSDSDSNVFFRPLFGNQRVIAIDPGVRTFLTVYAWDGTCHQFGTELHKEAPRNPRRLRDKMHYCIIEYLLKHYNKILLPEVFAPRMLHDKHQLEQPTKYALFYIASSFALFRKRLCTEAQKGKYGVCKVFAAREEFTTKACSKCGYLNDIGKATRFNCNFCGYTANRDINASRNILLSNYHACLG